MKKWKTAIAESVPLILHDYEPLDFHIYLKKTGLKGIASNEHL
ncbi:unnamed protein product [Meloidogyne enterolobii]|uniref:Uncharacterized protein n=1 Tax=Meloidogyne enterolobii TaxID=390850 RepID=A0ACB1AN54_MELEN